MIKISLGVSPTTIELELNLVKYYKSTIEHKSIYPAYFVINLINVITCSINLLAQAIRDRMTISIRDKLY